jgi:predicted amidohydrolase YtcJ
LHCYLSLIVWSVQENLFVHAALLILHNGQIATGNSDFASGRLIQHGILQLVGDDQQVLAKRTNDSTVIDLKRHTVIPGLNDSGG